MTHKSHQIKYDPLVHSKLALPLLLPPSLPRSLRRSQPCPPWRIRGFPANCPAPPHASTPRDDRRSASTLTHQTHSHTYMYTHTHTHAYAHTHSHSHSHSHTCSKTPPHLYPTTYTQLRARIAADATEAMTASVIGTNTSTTGDSVGTAPGGVCKSGACMCVRVCVSSSNFRHHACRCGDSGAWRW